jgi:hypothetical protein
LPEFFRPPTEKKDEWKEGKKEGRKEKRGGEQREVGRAWSWGEPEVRGQEEPPRESGEERRGWGEEWQSRPFTQVTFPGLTPNV